MKFGRIYKLIAEGASGLHEVGSPLTLRMRITTNSLFSCGNATIQIYNLAADVRADLYKDWFEIETYRQFILSAGYSSQQSVGGGIEIPIIFRGNITQAYSFRQGPDWVTEITALDGGFALDRGTIDLTKPSPWSFEDVMRDAVNQMPNVTLGLIGQFDIANSRGITFGGNPWELINRTVNPLQGQAFINKEKVYILNPWEYILDEGLLTDISADTGMIGTPKLQANLVMVRLIFEPRLEIAQKIHLTTEESRMSGDYKVLSVVHSGTISGAVCEELVTEVTLYQPDRVLVAA